MKKNSCSRDGGYKDDQDVVLLSRTSSSSKERHKPDHVMKAKAENEQMVMGAQEGASNCEGKSGRASQKRGHGSDS